jgi:hypothetical protein
MPLSGTEAALIASLKPEIEAQIKAAFGPPADAAMLTKFANAIATAVSNKIIPHITRTALVNSTGTVTTGPGTGGNVVATGQVT